MKLPSGTMTSASIQTSTSPASIPAMLNTRLMMAMKMAAYLSRTGRSTTRPALSRYTS
jgi:hypothetical protein